MDTCLWFCRYHAWPDSDNITYRYTSQSGRAWVTKSHTGIHHNRVRPDCNVYLHVILSLSHVARAIYICASITMMCCPNYLFLCFCDYYILYSQFPSPGFDLWQNQTQLKLASGVEHKPTIQGVLNRLSHLQLYFKDPMGMFWMMKWLGRYTEWAWFPNSLHGFQYVIPWPPCTSFVLFLVFIRLVCWDSNEASDSSCVHWL